jgi:hypothetical protein
LGYLLVKSLGHSLKKRLAMALAALQKFTLTKMVRRTIFYPSAGRTDRHFETPAI